MDSGRTKPSHRLLAALAVAQGTAETLADSWGDIDDESRRRVVELVLDQIVTAADAADDRPRLRAV
jgi:hypothetical protein